MNFISFITVCCCYVNETSSVKPNPFDKYLTKQQETSAVVSSPQSSTVSFSSVDTSKSESYSSDFYDSPAYNSYFAKSNRTNTYPTSFSQDDQYVEKSKSYQRESSTYPTSFSQDDQYVEKNKSYQKKKDNILESTKSNLLEPMCPVVPEPMCPVVPEPTCPIMPEPLCPVISKPIVQQSPYCKPIYQNPYIHLNSSISTSYYPSNNYCADVCSKNNCVNDYHLCSNGCPVRINRQAYQRYILSNPHLRSQGNTIVNNDRFGYVDSDIFVSVETLLSGIKTRRHYFLWWNYYTSVTSFEKNISFSYLFSVIKNCRSGKPLIHVHREFMCGNIFGQYYDKMILSACTDRLEWLYNEFNRCEINDPFFSHPDISCVISTN